MCVCVFNSSSFERIFGDDIGVDCMSLEIWRLGVKQNILFILFLRSTRTYTLIGFGIY